MTLDPQEHRDIVAAMPRTKWAPPLIVAIVLCSLAIPGLIIFGKSLFGPPHFGPIIAVGLLVLFVILTVLIIVVIAHYQRVRTQAIAIVADHFGLRHVNKPPKHERESLFSSFRSFTMLRHGAKNLKWWMGGQVDGRPIEAIEHTYIVSTGKSAHAVTHSVIATPVPHAWPQLALTSRHIFATWWNSVTGHDFKVENEAFNARWIIKTNNRDFTLLFLTPEIQQFLAASPRAESWQLANGSLAMVMKKRLDARQLPPLLTRVPALRNMLPPELDYWMPPHPPSTPLQQ